MIARANLPADKTPPHPEDVSQAAKIKERIRRWKDGQFKVSQEVRNATRSSRLVREGQYSRAAKALTSVGLAEHTRDTISAMQSLHPQGPRARPKETEPSSPPMRFSGEQVA